MFQPLTSVVAGAFWASEADFVMQLQSRGFQITPQAKFPNKPTKTWSYVGVPAPGQVFLTLKEGASVKVFDQRGQIDHQSFSTPMVPQSLGQYLTPYQHQFYVDYRNHPDFAWGIPVIGPAEWSGIADQQWLNDRNFSQEPGQPRFLPPLNIPGNFGMRFKPGASMDSLETVEVFPIEQYRQQFKPPSPVAQVAGEYAVTDEALASQAMLSLATNGITAAAGKAIRAIAEKRK